MKYRILKKREEEPQKVRVEAGKVWMCSLCKKAYGEGEVIHIKGVRKVCPNCLKTSLIWTTLEEFDKKYEYKVL